MRINEVTYTDAQPIEGYGPGFFRIGGALRHGPLLVSGAGPTPWTGFEDIAPLTALAADVDVLFLGTGEEVAHPPKALRDALEECDLGYEVMASPTACRSYNVLLSEGRRVALAVLPV